MKINNRQQLLVILAVVGVAFLILERLVVNPLIESWKGRATRIAELRRSITQGQSLLDRDQIIRERWEMMRTNTLPTNLSVAQSDVLKAFDRWTQDSRISFSGNKLQWKRNNEDYVLLDCRADAFGNIDAVTRFLHNIEKDPLALRIESVDITARDNTGQQLSVALQVTGLVLSKAEQ
jgi:hypothetical protein